MPRPHHRPSSGANEEPRRPEVETPSRSATVAPRSAKVDLTPAYPVRLSGFGFRRTESEGVTQRIHARALAVSAADSEPARSPKEGMR